MQDKYGFEPLPTPPLSPRDVGKLRKEQKLFLKMGFATRMPLEARTNRQMAIEDLLFDYEQEKLARKEGPTSDRSEAGLPSVDSVNF